MGFLADWTVPLEVIATFSLGHPVIVLTLSICLTTCITAKLLRTPHVDQLALRVN